MENSPVVIRTVSQGKKMYLSEHEPGRKVWKVTNRPFTDPEVLKFDQQAGLNIAKQIKGNWTDTVIQVIDMTGKTLEDQPEVQPEPQPEPMNEEQVQEAPLVESQVIGGDNFKFRQAVQKTHFTGYDTFTSEFDTEISQSNIIADWALSFWINDMGVENFIIDVQAVEGSFTVQMFDKHTSEKTQENAKNISDFEWKFVVGGEPMLAMNQSLYIRSLDFDFEDKTCTATF